MQAIGSGRWCLQATTVKRNTCVCEVILEYECERRSCDNPLAVIDID